METSAVAAQIAHRPVQRRRRRWAGQADRQLGHTLGHLECAGDDRR